MSALITQQYTEFPSIIKQAKLIAYLYKWVGLYSTVLLTIVTIISMSNVFTSGTLAHWSFVQDTWAIIFAAAIDVNIVRLFLEAHLEKSWGAYTIGIGLTCVTGAALLIEGLQQSIGLQWDNQIVQVTIGILISFRVLFVVVLMAREGTKLGKLVGVLVKPTTQLSVQPQPTPEAQPNVPQDEQEPVQNEASPDVQPDVPEMDTSPEHQAITNIRPMKQKKVNGKTHTPEQKARTIWTSNPHISARALAVQIGKSPTTANTWLKKFKMEQSEQFVATGGQ